MVGVQCVLCVRTEFTAITVWLFCRCVTLFASIFCLTAVSWATDSRHPQLTTQQRTQLFDFHLVEMFIVFLWNLIFGGNRPNRPFQCKACTRLFDRSFWTISIIHVGRVSLIVVVARAQFTWYLISYLLRSNRRHAKRICAAGMSLEGIGHTASNSRHPTHAHTH